MCGKFGRLKYDRRLNDYDTMKIVLIHQNFVDRHHPGGTRHFELAVYLVERGHEVTIIAGNLNYLHGQPTSQTKLYRPFEEVIDGVRILRAYAPPVLHRSFAWRAASQISFTVASIWAAWRAGPVDVVMGTSPPLFQLASAWGVSVLRRRPLLLEIRDLWPEFAIAMNILKNPILIILARWAERFFYARANHILVNSPAYCDYLLKQGLSKDKVTVIPNGVDAAMFDPCAQGDDIRRELGFDHQFLVTYAGALGQANDIGTILRAAHRLRDSSSIHFILVGDGKERKNLEQQAKNLKLDNVTFAGCFPKDRMRDVLAASNACIAILQDIPMFRTTYPNKVFDYMAAGRPTLLAIDGVIRQVVEDANGGCFVPPGNDRALADAVRRLHENPDESQRMGKSARQYVEQHFQREDHARRLEQLLVNLAT